VDRRRAGDRLQLLKEQRVSVSVLQRRRLEAAEVERLDPSSSWRSSGNASSIPAGRAATEQLLKRAAITEESRVLDVGCGVGTTAIAIAERFGAQVTAVDIEPLMLERANEAVRAAHAADRVHIQEGDILALGFPDGSFDVVIAEAVTMFVDRAPAAVSSSGYVARADACSRQSSCGAGRRARKPEKRSWGRSARGFASTRRAMTRPAYMKKMAWLMPRMRRAVPYLGYIVVSGEKQPQTTHTNE
jgi:SAM-dependent methyltransferase